MIAQFQYCKEDFLVTVYTIDTFKFSDTAFDLLYDLTSNRKRTFLRRIFPIQRLFAYPQLYASRRPLIEDVVKNFINF